MDWSRHREALEGAGVAFQAGLTAEEVAQIERRYGFRFPPDLRSFLMFSLPVSNSFVNWRDEGEETIRSWLLRPYEDMCFDIQVDGFWLRSWGPRPASLKEALRIAKRAVDAAPKLLPVFGHRFIPDSPHEEGNPVFSVHQTDIIYYGCNLSEYFENEFGHDFSGEDRYQITGPVKSIEFWSHLVAINNGEVDDGHQPRGQWTAD